MKRAGNLYGRIAEPENLRQAFLKAIRGKRGKAEVIAYTANLDRNLRRLHDQLSAGMWMWAIITSSPFTNRRSD
jgi:hypothetical protein